MHPLCNEYTGVISQNCHSDHVGPSLQNRTFTTPHELQNKLLSIFETL